MEDSCRAGLVQKWVPKVSKLVAPSEVDSDGFCLVKTKRVAGKRPLEGSVITAPLETSNGFAVLTKTNVATSLNYLI